MLRSIPGCDRQFVDLDGLKNTSNRPDRDLRESVTGTVELGIRSFHAAHANGSFCVDRFSNRVVLFRNVSFTVPVGPLRCLAMITSAMLSG